MRLILPKKSFFIFLIVLFFSVEGFSQTTGDYRSKNTSGNWTTASDWQYYNGSSWVNATTYPGQNTGTGAVLIQAGHSMSIGSGGITTQTIGTLTISGNLILNGIGTGGTGTNYDIKTSYLIVTSGLTPSATINFQNKVNLKLPTNAVINVSTNGLSGDCSNNQDIFIGSTVISYCNGGGGTPDFEEVMENGGYYVLNVSPVSDSSCGSKTFSFTATAFPASGSTIRWYTTSTGGSAFRTSSSGSDTYSPTLSTTTTYYVEASYSGYTTPRKIVTATVTNTDAPTGTTSQSFCASSNPTVANLSATGTGIKWYSTSTGGSALASTTVLTNGTHYYASQTLNGCESSSRLDVTVTVNALPTAVLTSSDVDNTFCTGTSVIFTATGGTNYNFRVGGSSVQNGTSSTYTTTALTNGQVVDVIVTNASGCTATSSGITNTVNALSTAGLTSSDADNTFCSGTSVTFTATGGTNYDFRIGGSSVQNGAVSTYITTVLTNGQVVDVIVTNASGCTTISSGITNTVNSLPSTPTAGTPTNPTCTVPTGSVVLSNLPASGTITRTGSYSNDSYVITGGGSQLITDLLPGVYYFAVTNGSCTSNTVTVTIVAPETNTWSGSWSNGAPTINQRLVFASDYTNANDVDIEGCSCQVTGTTIVTIKSGRTLKIENGVEVQPNAKLIFENDASLVQMNDAAVNSGNINYKRHTGFVKRYDFTYWSSPVAGQTLKALSPNTLYDKYYSYNPTSGWKIEYNGTAIMEKGRGYIIRAPQTFSITVPAVDTAPEFVGVPNNGLVSYEVPSSLVNLIGNPYPSAIDADKFIAANSTSLEGTLYFWTHNTSPSKDIAGDAIYNYTTNDYVTYNKTGGVNLATGKIAAGQSFFAPSTATGGTVVFNNAMRYTEGQTNYDNSQFYKFSSTSKTTAKAVAEIEKSRIWLNLTNKEGAYKQMLIGYIAGATNDYDRGFDGVSYDGNQYVDFYSVNQGTKLSIQGRAVPFVKQDSVALGYKSTIVGEFQISIDHTDGVLSSQNVFLEDKDLNILHDLKKGAYTFSTVKGTFKNRFVLRYVDKNAVEPEPVIETPQVDEVDKTIMVSVNNNEITVSSSEDLISKIIIYDVSGKIIYQKENVSANDFVIQNLLSSQQLLLVSLVLENGKTIATKVLY